MSNENTSIVSFCLYIGCGVFYLYKKGYRTVIKPGYLAIGGLLLLSVLVFYLSPARVVRSEYMHWEMSPMFIIKNSILSIYNWLYFFMCFWQYMAVYVLLLCMSRLNRVKIMDGRDVMLWSCFMLLFGVLFAAPVWGAPRSFLPLQLIFVILLTRLLYRNMLIINKSVFICIVCVFTVICSFSAIPRTYLLWMEYKNAEKIRMVVSEAKARGEQHVILREDVFDRAPLMEKCFLPNFLFNYRCRSQLILNTIDSKQKADVEMGHMPNTDPWSTAEHHDVYLRELLISGCFRLSEGNVTLF